MKRGSAIFLVVALAGTTVTYSQKVGIEAGFGLATTRMDDLKYLQEYILGRYPIQGKVISSFPAYATESVGIVHQLFPTVRIGAGYAFTATGGRTNYTDYSGSINTDILASSHRIGIFASYAAFSGERYDLSVYGQVDGNFSRIDITTSIYVLGFSDQAIDKFNAFSPNFSAGVELFLHLNDFSAGLYGGYLADMPGELGDREDGDPLYDPADRQRVLTTDWTGWRTGIKALIWLGQ
jgi:hypothetical protein